MFVYVCFCLFFFFIKIKPDDNAVGPGVIGGNTGSGESRFSRWFNNNDNSGDKNRLSSLQDNLINLISSKSLSIYFQFKFLIFFFFFPFPQVLML